MDRLVIRNGTTIIFLLIICIVVSDQLTITRLGEFSAYSQSKLEAQNFLVRGRRQSSEEGEDGEGEEDVCNNCNCETSQACPCAKCYVIITIPTTTTTTTTTTQPTTPSTEATTQRRVTSNIETTTSARTTRNRDQSASTSENGLLLSANSSENTKLYIGLAAGLTVLVLSLVFIAGWCYRYKFRKREDKFRLMPITLEQELNDADIQSPSPAYETAGSLRFMYELPPVIKGRDNVSQKQVNVYNTVNGENIYNIANASGRRNLLSVSSDDYDHAGCWDKDYASMEKIRQTNLKGQETITQNLYAVVGDNTYSSLHR